MPTRCRGRSWPTQPGARQPSRSSSTAPRPSTRPRYAATWPGCSPRAGSGTRRLFDVPEAPLDDGLLPGEAVASVREWLLELAADDSARGGIVERSLLGTLRSLVYAAHQVADAAWAQA